MEATAEIEALIRAKYSILFLVSWEEARVEQALDKICSGLNRKLHTWSVTQGMKPEVNRTSGPAKPVTLPPELEALATIHEAAEYTVFLLKDFHIYLKDPRVVRLLRDLNVRLKGRAQAIVLMGPTLTLPVSGGRLRLGTWQGIYLGEHRDRGGPRTLVLTLQGQTR